MIRNKQHIQFIRFGISGVAGFITDASLVVLFTRTFSIGPIPAQIIAFSVAVTVTWLINRHWTFAEHTSDRWLYEWGKYVAANSLGAAANNAVYVSLVLTTAIFSKYPVFAVALGSVVGMVFNFASSKHLVFNHKADRTPPLTKGRSFSLHKD